MPAATLKTHRNGSTHSGEISAKRIMSWRRREVRSRVWTREATKMASGNGFQSGTVVQGLELKIGRDSPSQDKKLWSGGEFEHAVEEKRILTIFLEFQFVFVDFERC